jgi:DNA-binding beta-propeller fold protein YncE
MVSLFRTAILIPACLWLLWRVGRNFMFIRLFPYGLPHRLDVRPTFSNVDNSNDSLRFKHGALKKIYERRGNDDYDTPALLSSPETVFFGPDNTMYTTTDQGTLISLTDWKIESDKIITAKTTLVKELGPGRPLGAKFTRDGSTVYVADAVLGLLRVRNLHDAGSKVEIVASTVVDDGKLTRILFADDLAIGPVSGKVYFTDASNVPPPRNLDMTFDVLYGSAVDLLKSKPTGRLLEYNPSTDTVTVLAKNLWFANGVGVDQDEEYLVVAETFGLRLMKYYLKGDKKGQSENIIERSPSPSCKTTARSNRVLLQFVENTRYSLLFFTFDRL